MRRKDLPQLVEELRRIHGFERDDRLIWKPTEIRDRREAKGWSQTKLAEEVGLKQPKISEIETGRRSGQQSAKENDQNDDGPFSLKMDAVTLYGLAKALECKLKEIAHLPEASSAEITSKQIVALQSQLLQVEAINTLIRPDEKTYIREIYYRTKLLDKAAPKSKVEPARQQLSMAFQADTLEDLRDRACVILGTAGQGKSILLRYLTIQEAIEANTLPLFFELRHLGAESLEDLILRRLQNFELCENSAQLSNILSEARVSLLFDAFDELAFDRRQSFLKDLGSLQQSYPQLRIVVTSRPDSGILLCDWLHPYSIIPLKPTDVESLIRIYAEDHEANQIVAQVRNADFEVVHLLTSPIFVVLLVIKFQYSHSIPRNIVSFYRDLFDALLRRHNRSETGLKRRISSELMPYELEKAFCAISYFIHKAFGDQPPHLRDVEGIAKKVAGRMALAPQIFPSIVQDIIQITNLILAEAGNCFYVHKTVKEFYAATYVAENSTDEQAAKFYSDMLQTWEKWLGILQFLELVDRQRYLRFFAIPDLRRFAPFRTIDIARSFRRVSVSQNIHQPELYHVELSETECHVFNASGMLTFAGNCYLSELRTMLGTREANRIRKLLSQQQSEVIIHQKKCHEREPGNEWDLTPILHELGTHLSGHRLNEKLQAWEAEVQLNISPDADFEIL